MIRHHFPQLFHFRFRKELSEVYISYAIRSFAYALVSIFIPAFLFSLGYSLKSIAIYYIFYTFFVGTGSIFTSSLFTKIGIKHGILISGPLSVLQFLMLYSLDMYHWPLILLALVSASASAFFWPAFHMEFVRSSDRKHRSEEVSALNVFSYIMMIFAPLIGGLIITFFDFHVLFIIVAVIFCTSSLPLFFTKERYEPFIFSVKDMFCKENLKDVSVFFGSGVMNYTHHVLWSLFIFLLLGTFLSLGILSTIMLCMVTIVTYLLGKISDRVNKHLILRIGAISGGLLWFVRPFASVFWHFAAINSLEGATNSFIHVPFFGIFYNRAQKKKNVAEYIVFRELAVNTLGGGFVLLLFLLTESFNLSFVLAGLATFGFAFF